MHILLLLLLLSHKDFWLACWFQLYFAVFTVLGALIGKQKGRNIEVMNSFELMFHKVEGDIVIDREYYNTKEEQCKHSCCTFHLFPFFYTPSHLTDRTINCLFFQSNKCLVIWIFLDGTQQGILQTNRILKFINR